MGRDCAWINIASFVAGMVVCAMIASIIVGEAQRFHDKERKKR